MTFSFFVAYKNYKYDIKNVIKKSLMICAGIGFLTNSLCFLPLRHSSVIKYSELVAKTHVQAHITRNFIFIVYNAITDFS